jgi:hypothetical protein
LLFGVLLQRGFNHWSVRVPSKRFDDLVTDVDGRLMLIQGQVCPRHGINQLTYPFLYLVCVLRHKIYLPPGFLLEDLNGLTRGLGDLVLVGGAFAFGFGVPGLVPRGV